MSNLARDIILRLGGHTKVSRATGIDVRTVHSWQRVDRDGIPPGEKNRNWQALLDMAEEQGVKLSLEELMRARG